MSSIGTTNNESKESKVLYSTENETSDYNISVDWRKQWLPSRYIIMRLYEPSNLKYF